MGRKDKKDKKDKNDKKVRADRTVHNGDVSDNEVYKDAVTDIELNYKNMQENEIILATKDIFQSFPVAGGEFVALKNINIDIAAKSLTILKGRSGSGKTTLMNILGALDHPKSGQVYLNGNDMTAMNEKQREDIRRKKIGFVFQSVALIPMMTAYENVEFALRLAGYKGNRRERTEEVLKLVGLKKRMNHMPQELSGGEQQRVAIARAIAHKPDIVFADEPTAELDSGTSIVVMKLFRRLVDEEGITVVMTTHDTGLMEAADRIYELEDGEIKADGIAGDAIAGDIRSDEKS